MIILLALLTLFIAERAWYYRRPFWHRSSREVLQAVSVVLLVCYLFGGTIAYVTIEADIERFRAARTTYTHMKEEAASVETAAAVIQVSRQNEWLAEVQYWNDTQLGIWIPDDVDSLHPIK